MATLNFPVGISQCILSMGIAGIEPKWNFSVLPGKVTLNLEWNNVSTGTLVPGPPPVLHRHYFSPPVQSSPSRPYNAARYIPPRMRKHGFSHRSDIDHQWRSMSPSAHADHVPTQLSEGEISKHDNDYCDSQDISGKSENVALTTTDTNGNVSIRKQSVVSSTPSESDASDKPGDSASEIIDISSALYLPNTFYNDHSSIHCDTIVSESDEEGNNSVYSNSEGESISNRSQTNDYQDTDIPLSNTYVKNVCENSFVHENMTSFVPESTNTISFATNVNNIETSSDIFENHDRISPRESICENDSNNISVSSVYDDNNTSDYDTSQIPDYPISKNDKELTGTVDMIPRHLEKEESQESLNQWCNEVQQYLSSFNDFSTLIETHWKPRSKFRGLSSEPQKLALDAMLAQLGHFSSVINLSKSQLDRTDSLNSMFTLIYTYYGYPNSYKA